MLLDEGFQLLTEDDALALLQTAEIGRVGVTVGALPAIFPVNYRVVDGAIVFRTSPGTKPSSATIDSVVAFEVDDHDPGERTGWSVLVVGRPEVVDDLDTTFQALDAGLEPYAGGNRSDIVRITPMFVSGRRIITDGSDHRGPVAMTAVMTHEEPLRHRYATPNGSPCPRTLRTDGTVEGSGDCLGCGVCMLFAGLLDLGTQAQSVRPCGTDR